MQPKGDLQLSIGYWIVSHKQTLRTWWGITSMAIIALSLLWMILFFTIYFGQEGKVNTLLISGANGVGSFTTTAFQPQPLTAGTVTVIPRDDKHVDLVTELTNPNPLWGAQALVVHFTVNGVAQTPLHFFVNQGEHRPVMQINATTTNPTTATAVLVIDDTAWVRASIASLPAASFTVENIQITPSTVTVAGQTQSSVSVSASVTNTSVYNFYHVDVPIVLTDGQRIVGVGQVGIDRWPTLVTRPVSLTLSYPVVQATEARIAPQVSRFDAGNTYR